MFLPLQENAHRRIQQTRWKSKHVIRLQKEILITRFFMTYELAGTNKTEITIIRIILILGRKFLHAHDLVQYNNYIVPP